MLARAALFAALSASLLATVARADYLLSSTFVGSTCGAPGASAPAGSAATAPATPILNVAWGFGCLNTSSPAGFACTGPGGGPAFGPGPNRTCSFYNATTSSTLLRCYNTTHTITYTFPTDNCYGFIDTDDYYSFDLLPVRHAADGCVPFADGRFSASAQCLNEGGYILQGHTYSVFYEYGQAAGFGSRGVGRPAPALPVESRQCKATSSDVFYYDQVGASPSNCWPFLADTTKPANASSITWGCAASMSTVIDNGSPNCNTAAAQGVSSPSSTPLFSASGSLSASGTPLSPSRSASASLGSSRSATASSSASGSVNAQPSVSRSPFPQPPSPAPAVLQYYAAADGSSCDRQYEFNVRQYPYEFLTSHCPYAPAAALDGSSIAAIAFAAVGGLTVLLVALIVWLQCRRAIALRQQRVRSVQTLMLAKTKVVAPPKGAGAAAV